jgi:hypothetical protein
MSDPIEQRLARNLPAVQRALRGELPAPSQLLSDLARTAEKHFLALRMAKLNPSRGNH